MSGYRVLTWHVHGSYLYYLAQTGHEFYLPFKPGRPESYGARSAGFDWPANVHEVPFERVPELQLDCVLFQSRKNFLHDRLECLSLDQECLPKLYLEHDPPCEHPTNTRHLIDDPNILLIHCTPFNELMWDSGRTPTVVIDHGVVLPEGVRYSGEEATGIVVVNDLARRGRRLGADVFEAVRRQVPLQLVGMGARELGGCDPLPHRELPAFMARHRLFFNPIRYTSLGLSVIEAMMAGLPITGLATTELAAVIENGRSGFVDTNQARIVDAMRMLLADPVLAREWGEAARRYARERFNIRRFTAGWTAAFRLATGREPGARALTVASGRSGL